MPRYVNGRLTIAKSEMVQDKGCRASLRGRHPPATFAQMEQQKREADRVPLFGATCDVKDAKISALQDNNPEVAFTHASHHHPYERERAKRRKVVLYLSELEMKASLRALPASCCCLWL